MEFEKVVGAVVSGVISGIGTAYLVVRNWLKRAEANFDRLDRVEDTVAELRKDHHAALKELTHLAKAVEDQGRASAEWRDKLIELQVATRERHESIHRELLQSREMTMVLINNLKEHINGLLGRRTEDKSRGVES